MFPQFISYVRYYVKRVMFDVKCSYWKWLQMSLQFFRKLVTQIFYNILPLLMRCKRQFVDMVCFLVSVYFLTYYNLLNCNKFHFKAINIFLNITYLVLSHEDQT